MEGLFRISGSQVVLNRLYPTFAHPEQVNLDNENCHDVASTFKHWLKHLNPPLIPFEYFEGTMQMLKDYEETKEVSLLKDFVLKLPKDHFVAFHKILRLLKVLSENSTLNKMTSTNLALIFGPSLLQIPPEKKLECDNKEFFSMEVQTQSSLLVVGLLDSFDTLFS
uniref:Rho-GAP domain-containing protein n=2 Tax=Arcella intermedia TaxID=1963864 RepID=A0A6B2LM90_9EUKA